MIIYSGKNFIKIGLIALACIGIAGYTYYQARNIVYGPQITLVRPINGSTVSEPLVTISGNAKNISFISLNDRQIFVDKYGTFSEELLLSSGYNIWELEAKDKFGRVVSKKIELVLRENS